MGSTYDGLAGNIVFPSTINISSSTNASPISVTVASPHNLQTGDQVTIAGHQTNTNANGAAVTVTRTGASTFTINGSTGNGVGGATGTVQPLTYGGATTIPSDGDPRNAASVNVPFQSILDRTQKILPALPYAKLAGRVVLNHGFGPGTAWCDIAGTPGAGVWAQYTTSQLLAASGAETGSLTINSISTGGNPALYSFSGVQAADILNISIESNALVSTTGDYVGLWVAITAPGVAAPAFPGGFSLLTGSARMLIATKDSFRCSGWLPHSGEGTLWVSPTYYSTIGGAIVTDLRDDTNLVVESWRPTGVPQ